MKVLKNRAVLLLISALGVLAATSAAQADWYGRYVYRPATWAALYGIEVPTTWSETFQHPDANGYYMRVTTNIYDRTHVHNYTWDANTPGGNGVWIEAHARCYDSSGSRGWYYQTRTSGMALKKQGEQVRAGCQNWAVMNYGRGWIWAP